MKEQEFSVSIPEELKVTSATRYFPKLFFTGNSATDLRNKIGLLSLNKTVIDELDEDRNEPEGCGPIPIDCVGLIRAVLREKDYEIEKSHLKIVQKPHPPDSTNTQLSISTEH